MAVLPQVAGPCAIYVAYPGINSGNPQLLGYTANGATISETPFFLNVPGDENGGDDGPPVEIQFLGQIHYVQLELTTFDLAILAHIRKFADQDSATLGTPIETGSMMFSATLTGRLTLVPSLGTGMGAPINFPRAFVRNSIDLNLGSKHSRAILQFECHKGSDGVLWNNSVTGI